MTDEGASPRELILEACRRNNDSLLDDVFSSLKPLHPSESALEQAIADLINHARDGVGHTPLHVAASRGSIDVLDILLDQPQVETDPLTRQGETPLHLAVGYCNSLEQLLKAEGHALVDMLMDAGCDPRIRNKSKMRPVDLVDARDTILVDMLKRGEMLLVAGNDVVNEDEEDDETHGPPSDSD